MEPGLVGHTLATAARGSSRAGWPPLTERFRSAAGRESELCRRFDVEGESARKLKRHAEVVKVGPSAERTREEAMANKDKGGAKNKKAASKTLKEKREAKKAKGKGSDRSGFSSGR
jgi:hypothetical protein